MISANHLQVIKDRDSGEEAARTDDNKYTDNERRITENHGAKGGGRGKTREDSAEQMLRSFDKSMYDAHNIWRD